MAKVTMKLEGFEQLQRALAATPAVAKAHAADAVQASAFAIAQRARGRVAVDTGALQRAIVSDARGTSGRVGLRAGRDGDRDPGAYWRMVEFGTVHQPARPFFRPAADEEEPAFIKRMRDIGPKIERDLSSGRFD